MKGGSSEQLKGLQTRRDKLKQAIDELKKQQADVSREISQKQGQLLAIEAEMKRLQNSKVIVSEHAILRFIERELQIDIEAIKAKILTERLEDLIHELGNGTYPIEGANVKAVVANNTITTVI